MAAAGFGQAVACGARAGVVGCGAMGRGIAQLLAQAGLEVSLFDSQPGAADAARTAIAVDLGRLVARGKISISDAERVKGSLHPVEALSRLADATLIVEAVYEDLQAKRQLFAAVEAIVADDAILVSNTSSLSIAAIASACRRPERVAGFHFFNPPPMMKVVEIVAAIGTDPAICDALTELTRRFGHTPVVARDTPGFIVNHAGRGYGTEGLRIVTEGICTPATLDEVLRDACGFKLGPCELLDLIGLDVSHPVMESIYHQYYEEPRYRPAVLTKRMVESGLLGRKRGAGFYRYVDGRQERPPAPPQPSVSPPLVWIDPAQPALAAHVRGALAPGVVIDEGMKPASDSLIVVTPLGSDATGAIVAAGLDARRAVGVDGMFPGERIRCLFANPALADDWRERARAAFAVEGIVVHLVRDSVGLIAQRVLAHLINVASSIAEQRIASPADIDRAVQLGLGYPQGPLAWGDALGIARIGRVLSGLLATTGDPRYRPTAWLARRAALGLSVTHLD